MPDRLNLSMAKVLIVDDSAAFTNILVQILLGFGVNQTTCCASAAEGQVRCQSMTFDLVLCDGEMPTMDGYAFVAWLRRASLGANSEAPIMMLTAHSSEAKVMKARSSGANFMVAKPITPGILLQRIHWITVDRRPLIECAAYVGPDRRAKERFPNPGRRKEDNVELNPDLVGVELSQDGIDALFD